MPPHLLTRLEAAIAASTDPVEADVLRAERVALLAREGRLDDARDALSPLRQRHHDRPDAATAAALALADAMVDYYSCLGGQARVKLQQARVLAASANLVPLQALCAAWLAHFDYVHDDIAGMVKHAQLALRLAAPDHHSARSRANLVVAMGYHYAGRSDRAQRWYALARHHASADGDAATVSALMFNMAGLRGDQARLSELAGNAGTQSDEALRALAASESSAHFDDRVGVDTLSVLQPILRAQLLVTQSRFAEALVLFEAHFADALTHGLGRMECSLRADVAWCRARLAQPALAREQALAAAGALRPECHVDDLALAHGRLAQVWRALGDAPAAEQHARESQRQLQRHVQQQHKIVEQLDAALGSAAP